MNIIGKKEIFLQDQNVFCVKSLVAVQNVWPVLDASGVQRQ